MAAVTELCFLLFVLVTNIHTDEQVYMYKKTNSHSFIPASGASLCLISRFVGEEKLVLWNSSDLWSENSTLPEDLKRRLSVHDWENVSNYIISDLTFSDSGLYREQCWTDGSVSYETNTSLMICGSVDERQMSVNLGETVDLSCDAAADNLKVQWFKKDDGSGRYSGSWRKLSEDSLTSEMDDVKGKNTSTLRVSDIAPTDFGLYQCVMMNQQQCVRGQVVRLRPSSEVTYGSVGETVVLQCPVSDNQQVIWNKYYRPITGEQTNRSLTFSSVTLNDSGVYDCRVKVSKYFVLIVCPEFDPATVELFSEGDNVTLTCRDSWGEDRKNRWFMRSNKTGGRVLHFSTDTLNMFVSDNSLVISNVSLEDTGEYWCAVTGPGLRCLSTSKYIVRYQQPVGFYSTFYVVRCSVLSGLLLMLCVAVAAVNHRTNRRQLPAHTHT